MHSKMLLIRSVVRSLSLCALTGVLFSACAHVQITDAEVCADAGFQGAFCAHTLTSETRAIAKGAWDAERVGQLCVQSSAYANWKTALEQLCYQTKNCTYKTKQALKQFFDNIEAIQAQQRIASSMSDVVELPVGE